MSFQSLRKVQEADKQVSEEKDRERMEIISNAEGTGQ